MPTVTLPDGRRVTFPDGTSQDDMVAALSQLPTLAPSHEPNAEPPAAPMVNVGGRGTGLDLRKSQSRMADALPILGGAGGAALGSLTSGVTGPVGPVAGAMLGRGAGEAVRSMARGEPIDGGRVIESSMAEGALQAVAPLGGAAAKGLYKGGVALLPKTLKQQFPKMAEAGFREGIALTRRGADKAGAAVSASAQQADDLIAASPAKVNPMRVVREMRPVYQKARQSAQLGRPDDRQAIVQRAKLFASRNRGGIDPVTAQALKRESQSLAERAYRTQDRGGAVNATDLLLDEATARGLRGELERVVPGVGPINARTQELIGLERGAEHAAGTGHVLSRLGGAGVGGVLASGGGAMPALAAAGAGMALTTPGGLTATGLALKPVAAHLPASVRAALLLSLLGQEQEQ